MTQNKLAIILAVIGAVFVVVLYITIGVLMSDRSNQGDDLPVITETDSSNDANQNWNQFEALQEAGGAMSEEARLEFVNRLQEAKF